VIEGLEKNSLLLLYQFCEFVEISFTSFKKMYSNLLIVAFQQHISVLLEVVYCLFFILTFSPSSHQYDIEHVKFSLQSLHYI